jgi:hypothetical protein
MFMGRLSKHVFAFIASSHEPTVHPRTMKSPQQPSLVGAGLCACAEISSAGTEARRHRFLSSPLTENFSKLRPIDRIRSKFLNVERWNA